MGEDLHFTGLIATCLFDKQPSKILALSLLHNKLSSTVYTAVVQISITTPWLGAHTQYYCVLDFYLDDGLALLGERQLGLHFPGDMFPLGGFRHPRRGVRRQQTAPVTSCCGMETAGFRRGRAPALPQHPTQHKRPGCPAVLSGLGSVVCVHNVGVLYTGNSRISVRKGKTSLKYYQLIIHYSIQFSFLSAVINIDLPCHL